MEKGGWVYVVASKTMVIYVGVTNEIGRRAYEHREHLVEGFTKRYNCERLIYMEHYPTIEEAIAREKQLKKRRREKKLGSSAKPTRISATFTMTSTLERFARIVIPTEAPALGGREVEGSRTTHNARQHRGVGHLSLGDWRLYRRRRSVCGPRSLHFASRKGGSLRSG